LIAADLDRHGIFLCLLDGDRGGKVIRESGKQPDDCRW